MQRSNRIFFNLITLKIVKKKSLYSYDWGSWKENCVERCDNRLTLNRNRHHVNVLNSEFIQNFRWLASRTGRQEIFQVYRRQRRLCAIFGPEINLYIQLMQRKNHLHRVHVCDVEYNVNLLHKLYGKMLINWLIFSYTRKTHANNHNQAAISRFDQKTQLMVLLSAACFIFHLKMFK